MCRRCNVALVLDIGPRDDPDATGNVVVEQVEVCLVCGTGQRVQREPITAEWVRRRRAIVAGEAP